MSPRKIIFLTIVGIGMAGLLFWAWWLSQKKNTGNASNETLSIWVTEGTTEQYNGLLEGFRKYAPEYAKSKIEIRVFPEYSLYQKILLNTLADGKGPDIFMVDAGWDSILSTKVEPIPNSAMNFSNFEKEYEDIFLPLLTVTGSKDASITYLHGIPLGYETLGMFYNKSLIRSVPKTWNEVMAMYSDTTLPSVIPTNIGLSSRYTPMNIDVLSYFLSEQGTTGYDSIGKNGSTGIQKYLSYGQMTTTSNSNTDSQEPIANVGTSLNEQKAVMESTNPWLTTIDLFMRWNIAFIIGYPSMIHDIEHAKKRAGSNATDGLILTEKLPQDSLGKMGKNMARYFYFGLSKQTKNQNISVKFMEYLLTEEAEMKYLASFPTKIAAKKSFYTGQEDTVLSSVFQKAKLWAFIPDSTTSLSVFQFGIRDEFQKIFDDTIDRNSKIDTNNLSILLSTRIGCSLESLNSAILDPKCSEQE